MEMKPTYEELEQRVKELERTEQKLKKSDEIHRTLVNSLDALLKLSLISAKILSIIVLHISLSSLIGEIPYSPKIKLFMSFILSINNL